jgi:hypothetical protein
MNCKTCPLDEAFWMKLFDNKEAESMLLRLYYSHSFKFNCLDKVLKLCPGDSSSVALYVLQLLERYTLKEIIDVLIPDFKLREIAPGDVPQFSDLNDSFYKVPFVLMNSGLDSVSYEQIGYYLRRETRSALADKKYGENHAKTSMQLGLCELDDSRHKVQISSMGKIFYTLPEDRKKKLIPKLCLYIPLIQNYFLTNRSEDVLDSGLSVLSESTRKRRRPNVNTLIDIIERSLADEL